MSIVSGRQRWLSMAIFLGAIYLAVDIISSALAGAAASEQMRFFWRLSAFVIRAVSVRRPHLLRTLPTS